MEFTNRNALGWGLDHVVNQQNWDLEVDLQVLVAPPGGPKLQVGVTYSMHQYIYIDISTINPD